MELITPSVEIWEQNNSLDGIWAHIARCTRVCYQSTPKNDGETDEEFVKRVILRTNPSTGRLEFDKIHGAMLEHGTVYLYSQYGHYKGHYDSNPYSVINWRYPSHKDITKRGTEGWYVTTNLRVIYENGWLDDLQYICKPTIHHAKRVTVSFITNIGVTREFNRHRVNSIAEESTRYCNYNKRNDGQIKIGLSAWLLDNENISYIEHHADDDLHSYCTDIADGDDTNWCDIDYYLFALSCAEYCYNNLIRKGWKPQQAREVLPLATKSQLIHTAFLTDWYHFLNLRYDGVSGPPHPNAKLVSKPLYDEFVKRGYIKVREDDTMV